MQNLKMLYLILIVFVCVILTSCAITYVPSRWLPDAEHTPMNPYGAWVEVKVRDGKIMGELIAVTDDTLFVADTTLHAIATTDIIRARLVTYDASNLGLFGAMLAGTIFTITHGWFLTLTAPMWIIGSSIAAISRSYDPIIDYPKKSLKHFSPYARYPQGLPSEIDRSRIKMKRVKLL